MDREEAKAGIHNDWEWIVDNIYNDFESRICKNCKYKDKYSCPIYDYESGLTPQMIDFGCNKFKRKV